MEVFLKIESALQMDGAVIVVVITVRSKTVLPEQNGGPGTQKSREVTDFARKTWTEPTRARVGVGCVRQLWGRSGVGHRSLHDLLPATFCPAQWEPQFASQTAFPQRDGFWQNTQSPQVLPMEYRNYINNINIFSYILAI